MQVSWSLVLNILLLVGVFIAIGRMIIARRQSLSVVHYQPSPGLAEKVHQDDIIAVRKITSEAVTAPPLTPAFSELVTEPFLPLSPKDAKDSSSLKAEEKKTSLFTEPHTSVMLFLLAKENRQLAGYELLQTVLAVGLRFGEGQLFHRHQSPNGQGPVLFSLATATASGTFDLQNIGAFSVHGLCLFMHASGSHTIDADRFAIMVETAKQLSEGLDTHLLDDRRQPFSTASIERYHRMLDLVDVEEYAS